MAYDVYYEKYRFLYIVIGVICVLAYISTDPIQDVLQCTNSKCCVTTKNTFNSPISKKHFYLNTVETFNFDECEGLDFHKSKYEHRTPLCIFTVNKYTKKTTQITKTPIRTEDRVKDITKDLNKFLTEKAKDINYEF